jgi:hypothetical protein
VVVVVVELELIQLVMVLYWLHQKVDSLVLGSCPVNTRWVLVVSLTYSPRLGVLDKCLEQEAQEGNPHGPRQKGRKRWNYYRLIR